MRQLGAINRDRHSGAAQLALQAADGMRAWLAREPEPTANHLLTLASLLCHTQSMMAPFRRLANLAALAADAADPVRDLTRSLRDFARTAHHGPHRIAQHFRATLANGPRLQVVTFSYSSTVLRSLIAARTRITRAYISLASPENEGRTLALRLARGGVKTCLTTDVDLPKFLESDSRTILVVGADQVRERDFVNRAGTERLVERARACGVKIWVLADTTKLCSRKRMGMGDVQTGWTEALVRRPVHNLQAYREILSASPLAPSVRVLTEHGPLTPAQVRRAIRGMNISPRLRALAD